MFITIISRIYFPILQIHLPKILPNFSEMIGCYAAKLRCTYIKMTSKQIQRNGDNWRL